MVTGASIAGAAVDHAFVHGVHGSWTYMDEDDIDSLLFEKMRRVSSVVGGSRDELMEQRLASHAAVTGHANTDQRVLHPQWTWNKV